MNRSIFVLVACLAAGSAVDVQAGCLCNRCNHNCCKYCKLVPDIKKETTYEYRAECEDFCVPGPSKCLGWEKVCECGKCPRCVRVMQPTCACIRTKTKLVKIPVVKEKCGWKCVVVCQCRGCNHCMASREATAAETQLAIDEAARQGILQVNYEQPIVVAIPDDEASPQAGAEAPVSVVPRADLQAIESVPAGGVRRGSTAFGALFEK